LLTINFTVNINPLTVTVIALNERLSRIKILNDIKSIYIGILFSLTGIKIAKQ